MKPFRGAILNHAHPLARGLVGCWLLNEQTGYIAHDYSGNGRTGTLTAFDVADPWVGTPGGTAVTFNSAGGKDHIRCETQPGTNSAAFSSFPNTMWAIAIPAAVGQESIIAVSDLSAADDFYLVEWSASDGKYQFHRRAGGTSAIASGGTVTGGPQTIVAVTRAANDAELYVDGVSVGTNTASRTPSNLDVTTIGVLARSGAYTTSAYNGEIIAAGIYDRALSVDDIASLTFNPYQMWEPAFSPAIFGTLAGATSVGWESLLMPYLGVMGVTAAAAGAKILMRFGGGHGWMRGSSMDN